MLTRREGQAQYLHVKKSLNENYLNHFGKTLSLRKFSLAQL